MAMDQYVKRLYQAKSPVPCLTIRAAARHRQTFSRWSEGNSWLSSIRPIQKIAVDRMLIITKMKEHKTRLGIIPKRNTNTGCLKIMHTRSINTGRLKIMLKSSTNTECLKTVLKMCTKYTVLGN